MRYLEKHEIFLHIFPYGIITFFDIIYVGIRGTNAFEFCVYIPFYP